MPTPLLERALAFLQTHPGPDPFTEADDERNESNEPIPSAPDVGGAADIRFEASPPISSPDKALIPLDAEIARSEARKHDRADIVARLARLQARAAAPGASPLDRELVADWRQILAAKDG